MPVSTIPIFAPPVAGKPPSAGASHPSGASMSASLALSQPPQLGEARVVRRGLRAQHAVGLGVDDERMAVQARADRRGVALDPDEAHARARDAADDGRAVE